MNRKDAENMAIDLIRRGCAFRYADLEFTDVDKKIVKECIVYRKNLDKITQQLMAGNLNKAQKLLDVLRANVGENVDLAGLGAKIARAEILLGE